MSVGSDVRRRSLPVTDTPGAEQDHREQILAPRRALLDQALHVLAGWHAQQKRLLDWVRPDGGAMCCLLRSDQFDDRAVARFWQRLPANDLQFGAGPWFGESPRVFGLGFGLTFGYLPLLDFHAALQRLAETLNDVRG